MSRDRPASGDEPSDQAITAWARLVRVSQDLIAAVEADLKTAGFPPLSWYDALLELKRAGPEGLRPFQLQAEMLLAQYNLSRLIDRLVAAGYVARLPSPDDRRGRVLTITPEGRRLLRRMWPVYRAAIASHFASALTQREVGQLDRILVKLRQS